MKKLSEINEGFWKDGIKRAKTGALRKEDIINSNINNFKEIDLGDFCPFYIADINLEIDNEEFITFDEWRSHKSKIEKTGWRMPTKDEWKDIVMSWCKIKVDFKDDDMWDATLVSKYNETTLGTEISRYTGAAQMWLEDEDQDSDGIEYNCAFNIWLKNSRISNPSYNYIYKKKSDGCIIRLIKDK